MKKFTLPKISPKTMGDILSFIRGLTYGLIIIILTSTGSIKVLLAVSLLLCVLFLIDLEEKVLMARNWENFVEKLVETWRK